jgi:exonuclease SbcC
MRSGGVSLDAIFIDEGFGSLDEEALDRAIDVLDRIRGERMIGIVSHVAELRVRIPSQILVTGGKSGSTLEIVG